MPSCGILVSLNMTENILNNSDVDSCSVEQLNDSLLSVVIPTHNEEKTIIALLDLIKAEGVPCEVIIVNNGSTDNTERLVTAYQEARPGFSVRLEQSELGVSNARNRGAEVAHGEHVLFLDADTRFEPGFIAAALENFKLQGLDAAGFDLVPDNDAKVDRLMLYVCNKIQNLMKHVPGGATCIGAAMLVKTEFHKKIGGFDSNIKFCEDMKWAKMAAEEGDFGIVDECVVFDMSRFRTNGKASFIIRHLRNVFSFVFTGDFSEDLKREYKKDRYGNKFS